MRVLVGILCSALWLIYIGQLISTVNFALAQRLGLQEHPDNVDSLFSGLELWAARWDLLWLWILPSAGVLMLIDHPWWPYAALIGGGTHVDTGGREGAKLLGLGERGVRVGTSGEQRLAMGVFTLFIVVGALAIITALMALV